MMFCYSLHFLFIYFLFCRSSLSLFFTYKNLNQIELNVSLLISEHWNKRGKHYFDLPRTCQMESMYEYQTGAGMRGGRTERMGKVEVVRGADK